MPAIHETTPADIAVIGMACRLPGADDPQQYWVNLREGVESIRWYSDEELRERWVPEELIANPRYVKASGAFRDGEGFDAAFFGYSAREAEIIDPQHRHFLEVSYHALEDSGYDPARYDGLIGVYGGSTMNTYLAMNVIPHGGVVDLVGDLQVMIGSDKEYMPNRVSYKLDLTGPSVAVQSACCTSLTAIHTACQAILAGECDMALAGGSSVRMPYMTGYLHNPVGTSSPDGHCRAFDVNSGGSVVGNGAGVVVLKHVDDALRDGDHVYAVIKGTAINNDGAQKASFTAPSVRGQARAAASALIAAQVGPEEIGFVEAHGTGTPLGDPIEVAALTEAFREGTDRTGYCALGSVKTNIGHLDAAAGVAGFIKAVQALRHRMIPPTVHFTAPNPQLRLEESPFFVNNELIDWESDTPRLASVNSLGMGGTNAHVILQEAPPQTGGDAAEDWQLVILSAHTETALDTASLNLARRLHTGADTNFADVAHTLQVGRRPLRHRRAVVARDAQDACFALETSGSSRVVSRLCDPPATGVAFLLAGQGVQFPGMAGPLYRSFPAFREAFDTCVRLLPGLGDELTALLVDANRADEEAARRLRDTEVTQPALFTVEFATATLLRGLGLEPAAMIGHSVGEYVVAVLAGVMDVQDALRLVAERGRLMSGLAPGAMLSVALGEAEVERYLVPGVGVAAVNTSDLVTLSGEPAAIREVRERLEADRVVTRDLHVSRAFHSAMVEPVLEAFREVVAKVKLRPAERRFLSNVTGTWITDEQCTDPDYWVRHLREPVRFAAGCAELAKESGLVLMEIGGGSTLTTMARAVPEPGWSEAVAVQPGATDRADGRRSLLHAVGTAWAAGLAVDWSALWTGREQRRVPLPTYPFEHRRYWLDPAPRTAVAQPAAPPVRRPEPSPVPAATASDSGAQALHRRPVGATLFVAPADPVQKFIAEAMAELLGIDRLGVDDNFFALDANSLMAVQLIARIRAEFDVDLPMTELFQTPTVAGLAERVNKETGATARPGADVKAAGGAAADDELVQAMQGLSEAEIHRLLAEVEGDGS